MSLPGRLPLPLDQEWSVTAHPPWKMEGKLSLGLSALRNSVCACGGGFRCGSATWRRRGSIHVDRLLDLILDFAGRLLELLDALAEPLREFRQLFGAENDQHDRQDRYHFPSVQPGKYRIHIIKGLKALYTRSYDTLGNA